MHYSFSKINLLTPRELRIINALSFKNVFIVFFLKNRCESSLSDKSLALRWWYDENLIAKIFYVLFQTCFHPNLILFESQHSFLNDKVRRTEFFSSQNELLTQDWKYLASHEQGESLADMSSELPVITLIFAYQVE